MFFVNQSDAHAQMTCIFLTLVLEPEFSDSCDPQHIKDKHPLARYAAQNWPDHYHEATTTTYVEAQAHTLFKNSGGCFDIWVRLWNVDNDRGELRGTHIPTPIYYASLLGLMSTVQELLDKDTASSACKGSSVLQSGILNAQGGKYGTALQAASAMGHAKVAQLILRYGADANQQGGRYGTALQAAVALGYIDIVRLVVANPNINVNIQRGAYGTALHAASLKGHTEMVQIFLERGADVNRQEGHYGTPLQVAAVRGHEDIVKLLLKDSSLDVNARGGQYGTALQAASVKGYFELAEMFIMRGANTNLRDGEYGSALQAASGKGHLEIV
jgi:ankyrin repeat protein